MGDLCVIFYSSSNFNRKINNKTEGYLMNGSNVFYSKSQVATGRKKRQVASVSDN